MHQRRIRKVNGNEYTPVESCSKDAIDGYQSDQFFEPKSRFPLKQIVLIVGFMICGAICITFSILISANYFDAKYQDRVWPLLMVGILMFIPGGYYGYILICILFKRDGFTYEDIPIF